MNIFRATNSEQVKCNYAALLLESALCSIFKSWSLAETNCGLNLYTDKGVFFLMYCEMEKIGAKALDLVDAYHAHVSEQNWIDTVQKFTAFFRERMDFFAIV